MAGENQVLAGKAGAIDAVVAAMRAHVGNAGVSEQACLALDTMRDAKGTLNRLVMMIRLWKCISFR